MPDPTEREKLAEEVHKQLLAGKNVKEVFEVSEEVVEGLYSFAYQKYRAGEYEEAAELFRYLVILEARNYKFLLGLAACLQKLQDYPSAASAYLLATMERTTDPVAYFHGANCFLKADQPETAYAFLKTAIHNSGDDPRFAEIKERAKLMADPFRKKLEKSLKK